MSADGTLRVSRPGGRYRDARRAYRVVVDGQDRGELLPGASLDVPLAAGPHVVRASIDWAGSPEVEVDVLPRRAVVLRAEPAGSPVTALFQMIGRHRYLRLVPDQG